MKIIVVPLKVQKKRYRREQKSKEKRNTRHKQVTALFVHNAAYRRIGRKVKSFSEAFQFFMPNHFSYLVSSNKSPFFLDSLPVQQFRSQLSISIPEVFSIVSNPDDSYKCIGTIISAIVRQSCHHLLLDYEKCNYCDLATQVFLDSILIDNDRFVNDCKRANVDRYLKIQSIGANHINNTSLQQMINSVGSPVELLNRKVKFPNVIPFKLRHIDGYSTSKKLLAGQKELDASDLIQYVLDCLSRFNKTLTQAARQELGNVIGEIISNAEEHSTLRNRYLIGYMDESNIPGNHYGILNLVMMNTGGTIYEKFKYPTEGQPFNTDCIVQMQALSDSFKQKNFFRWNAFTEENLWTLYSLQGGVSSVPPSVRKRGNGTIEFIDSFFKLKGSNDVDKVSCMNIISGNTRIDFDGTYRVNKTPDSDGHLVGLMTFNHSNTLNEKPDSKYVYHIKNYFPGTLICAKLLINDDDIL